jgi:hypothetical protein
MKYNDCQYNFISRSGIQFDSGKFITKCYPLQNVVSNSTIFMFTFISDILKSVYMLAVWQFHLVQERWIRLSLIFSSFNLIWLGGYTPLFMMATNQHNFWRSYLFLDVIISLNFRVFGPFLSFSLMYNFLWLLKLPHENK